MEDEQNQVLNLERVQALEILAENNQHKAYTIWDGPVPGTHCEVFINQIPRDTYEDLLIPLFSSVGPLWEFRLMMNFSGQNRGFAYAKYSSSGVAADAIRLLHGHMLEPGFHLSVRRSTEKRHLCIGDLPVATRQEDLLQVMSVLADGVERVSLKAEAGIEGVSAIVAFSSHHAASIAKKMLVEVFKKQFALTISIKWHSPVTSSSDEPLPPHKPSKSLLMSPLKPLHLLNAQWAPVLPPHLTIHPSISQGFCQAVGGPAVPPCSSTLSSLGQLVTVVSPTMVLQRLCEASGVGQPLYEICYSHTGPDGFLYFTYMVCVPRVMEPFRGLVMVLPGPTATSTLEEAQQVAAQQVLQRVQSKLSPSHDSLF
nr:dead end [Rachycentron canadum]